MARRRASACFHGSAPQILVSFLFHGPDPREEDFQNPGAVHLDDDGMRGKAGQDPEELLTNPLPGGLFEEVPVHPDLLQGVRADPETQFRRKAIGPENPQGIPGQGPSGDDRYPAFPDGPAPAMRVDEPVFPPFKPVSQGQGHRIDREIPQREILRNRRALHPGKVENARRLTFDHDAFRELVLLVMKQDIPAPGPLCEFGRKSSESARHDDVDVRRLPTQEKVSHRPSGHVEPVTVFVQEIKAGNAFLLHGVFRYPVPPAYLPFPEIQYQGKIDAADPL